LIIDNSLLLKRVNVNTKRHFLYPWGRLTLYMDLVEI
jgi:hypothetical protein